MAKMTIVDFRQHDCCNCPHPSALLLLTLKWTDQNSPTLGEICVDCPHCIVALNHHSLRCVGWYAKRSLRVHCAQKVLTAVMRTEGFLWKPQQTEQTAPHMVKTEQSKSSVRLMQLKSMIWADTMRLNLLMKVAHSGQHQRSFSHPLSSKLSCHRGEHNTDDYEFYLCTLSMVLEASSPTDRCQTC